MTSPEWPPVSDAEVQVPITCGRCGWVGEHGTLWKHVRDVHEPVDPSTAEVEAAAEAILTLSYPRSRWSDCSPIMRTNFIEVARAALTAARSALPEVGTVEAVEALLAEADGWRPMDSRDAGTVFAADSVTDLLADIRAALARTTPPTEAGTVEARLAAVEALADEWEAEAVEAVEVGLGMNRRHWVNWPRVVALHAALARTTPPTEAGDVEAAVAAERERVAVAIEATCLRERHIGPDIDVVCGRCATTCRIARTPTATEGG